MKVKLKLIIFFVIESESESKSKSKTNYFIFIVKVKIQNLFIYFFEQLSLLKKVWFLFYVYIHQLNITVTPRIYKFEIKTKKTL